MCGLIGFSGSDMNVDKIKLLLFWNSLERGKDATGIYSRQTGIIKDNNEARIFIKNNNDAFKNCNLFIGHVRAKTSGFNTKDNAHPFSYNGIVLAHNGTLYQEIKLCQTMGLNYTDFDVDSEILAAGIGKTLDTKVLTAYEGSAAVLFTDHNNKNSDILYAYRDKNRPLFRGSLDNSLYISSIKESLEFIGCNNIKEFKENHLYAIKNGKIDSYVKIKNPNVISTTTHISSCGVNSNSEFVGSYVVIDTEISTNSPDYEYIVKNKVKKGNSYYVNSFFTKDSKPYFNVKCPYTNKVLDIPKYVTAYTKYTLKTGDYALCMANLTYTSKEKKGQPCAAIGDLLKVIGFAQKNEKDIEVKNLSNGETFWVDPRFIRGFYNVNVDQNLLETLKKKYEDKENNFLKDLSIFSEVYKDLDNMTKSLSENENYSLKNVTEAVDEIKSKLEALETEIEQELWAS
jgi:hypothetical protein